MRRPLIFLPLYALVWLAVTGLPVVGALFRVGAR